MTVLLAISCAPRAEPEFLEFASFAQAGASEVFLNEELDLRFSVPIDPTSIHPGSARVTDARGHAVPGEWSVERRGMRFLPSFPTRPDLLDGGLQPGRSYRVELAGFPRIDGLRSREGAPLDGSRAFTFRTVDQDAAEGPFLDDRFGPPDPVVALVAELGPLEPLLLATTEPVDPRTLDRADFELIHGVRGDGGGESQGISRIALHPELVENRRDGARVALWPLAEGEQGTRRVLEAGEYLLVATRRPLSMREFGGHPFQAGFGATAVDGVWVRVQPEAAAGDAEASAWSEEFGDLAWRSDAAPNGSDGTALWTGDGAVRVRFPRAAGRGADGVVRLTSGSQPDLRIEATRIELSAGERVEPPGAGLVWWSAQGRWELDGVLERRVQAEPWGRREDESPEDWWLRLRQAPPGALVAGPDPAPAFLSELLEAAARDGRPWTVLVAGGDLVVRGELSVDGPLLLVAGGWVRLSGRIHASEVWTSAPRSGVRTLPLARDLPWRLETPTENPLGVPLRWSIRSRPWTVAAPLGPARIVADPGDGAARVSFYGETLGADGMRRTLGPVEDPSLLLDTTTLVYRIDLELPPAAGAGSTFRPPWVDAIRWTTLPASAAPR